MRWTAPEVPGNPGMGGDSPTPQPRALTWEARRRSAQGERSSRVGPQTPEAWRGLGPVFRGWGPSLKSGMRGQEGDVAELAWGGWCYCSTVEPGAEGKVLVTPL